MVDTTGFGNSHFQSQASWKSWYAFAAGGIATFLLIYVGIARPAAEELSLLRDQIRALEKSIAMVAGQRDAVDDTNHLLSLLSQQQSQANAARKTLIELRELTTGLSAQSAGVDKATATINQLASMKDLLLANADGIAKAADVLNASEDLQTRLTNSAPANELALRASLDLLAIRGELLNDIGSNSQAKHALNDLVKLRASLNVESSEIEIAQNRVSDLISLKDAVLSQTNDLSESIETLELTNDLSDRFRTAALSFKGIRDWMIEMVAMEPTFTQVRRILEPMGELVNLKRMDPNQIRDFTRAFVQQSQDRLASKSSNMVSLRSSSDKVSATSDAANESTIE